MKKEISTLFNWFVNFYIYSVVTITTIFILLLAIFGGSFELNINWNSWSELIKTLKK